MTAAIDAPPKKILFIREEKILLSNFTYTLSLLSRISLQIGEIFKFEASIF